MRLSGAYFSSAQLRRSINYPRVRHSTTLVAVNCVTNCFFEPVFAGGVVRIAWNQALFLYKKFHASFRLLAKSK